MNSKAKVYRNGRSPYWQAWFEVWDAQKQAWKPKMQSTRCAEEGKALEIAQALERVALTAGGMKTRLSRDFVVKAVNSILATSGHRAVEDQKKWSDYAIAWLAAQKKRVPGNLSQRSYLTYKSHVAKFTTWLGKNASTPLCDIEGEMLNDWYTATREAGLSSTTVNGMANTLAVIFEKAKDEGFTTRNPVNLISRDTHSGNRRDDFTEEQMWQIIHHLQASKAPLHKEWLTVFLLGCCTSQRLGDCRTAVRSAFDLADPFIVWTVTPSKTASSTRTTLRIPIVEPAASHIAQLLRSKATALFLAPTLAQLSGQWEDNPSTQFMTILEACGVHGRKIAAQGDGHSFSSLSFHSTRHTCNSLLANAGVPIDVRRQITGHASEKMNIHYTHLNDKTKADALTKAFTQKTRPNPKKAS